VAFTDVHYDAGGSDGATAACVVAADWTSSAAREEHVVAIESVNPYRAGAFFERELPCLVRVLALLSASVQVVVVDGYVELDERGAPGLGAHLHDSLGGRVAVVGVAKTSFRGATFATEVLRGTSRSPLYVTARGIATAEAARLVRTMHGPHRLPTLITRVDHLARGHVQPNR
jgi:deoxyribonuclease V